LKIENPRIDLKGMLPEELQDFLSSLGKERYRTKQMLGWIYGKGIHRFDEMTDLAKSFRTELARIASVSHLVERERTTSGDGKATKFLFELEGGLTVESVLIEEGDRRTVCLSSQVGCALGCRFCSTGRMGLRRNLSAAEIIDQLLAIRRSIQEEGKEIRNVVLMGMGEPLLNYENVLRAIRLMKLEMGPAIGARRITLSTSGIVPGIRRLAREGMQIGLALSLNATTDPLRSRLMPINRRYPIAEVIEAGRAYAERTGRWITLEYVLLRGENDAPEDARRLAGLVRTLPAKVNLIPFNPRGSEATYRRPSRMRIEQFQDVLFAHHVTATLRESRGGDIAAACGQLVTPTSRSPSGPARPDGSSASPPGSRTQGPHDL